MALGGRGGLVAAAIVSLIIIFGVYAATLATINKNAAIKPLGAPTKAIKIGCVSVPTGPYAQADKSIINGLNLWAQDASKIGIKIGGDVYKVEIVCKTVDKPTFTNLALAYTNLITKDKVDYLVGPSSNEYAAAAIQIAETYKKLLVLTNTFQGNLLSHNNTKYTFMLETPLFYQVSNTLNAVKEVNKNITQVVIIYENSTSSYGRLVKEAFEKILSASTQFKYVAALPYTPGKNVGAIAANVKNKNLNPNLVVIAGLDPNSIEQLVSGLKAENIQTLKMIVVFTIPSGLSQLEKNPTVANGVYYVSQWEPIAPFNPLYARNKGIDWYGYIIPDTFVKEYYNKYGSTPDEMAALGYAAGLLIQAGLEKANSLDSTVLSDTINNMRIMTFYGPIWFQNSQWSPGGYKGVQAGHPTLLVEFTLQNGHLVKKIVYPADIATFAQSQTK